MYKKEIINDFFKYDDSETLWENIKEKIDDLWYLITPFGWLYRLPGNLFGDWPRQVKWAYQRVVRGYDNRCYWDLDSYLGPLILRHLKSFRENNIHGYPGHGDADTPEKWEAILDRMIEGWEFFADPEKYEAIITEELGDTREGKDEYFMGVRMDSKLWNKACAEEYEKQYKEAKEKAALLIEWFHNLWD